MTTILLVLLSVFGGVAWGFAPAWYGAFAALLPAAVLWAVIERGGLPAWRTWLPAVPVLAAAGLSMAANPGSYAALLPLWAWGLAAPLLLRDLPGAMLPAGLAWFALFPAAEQLTGLNLSSNVQAEWGYLYCLAALGSGRPWLAVLFGAVPVALLSRGGMIGLAAGLLVYAWPQIPEQVRCRWPWGLPAGMAALVPLWMLRPSTAGVRIDYISQALAAWRGHEWLGIGPGNLSALGLIVDPRYGYQVHHAHNLYIDILVELGIVGAGLVIAAAVLALSRSGRPRWALASLAALAAHGLVDNPVYLPGVMVYIVAVAVIQENKNGTR